MAIYHAHIKSFSRGKGESSVAAAAYRAGIDLIDTTKHIEHRYAQRKGVRAFHMLAPKGAPEWCRDPEVFWDANEAYERRQNSIVGRELEVALPSELTDDQRECLALALGQELVDRFQVAVLVAIHEPSTQGDQRNHHVHLLISARQVGPEGLGKRACAEFDARQGKGADAVREVREWVGKTINAHLDRAGQEARVDHRSLKVQAAEALARGDAARARELDRAPTRHVGKVATAAHRKAANATPLLSIFGAPTLPTTSEAALDAAMEQARREGRLAPTPVGASYAQAFADQQATGGAGKASKIEPGMPRSQLRRLSWPRQSQPSPVALHLSQRLRLARVHGNGSEALNAQAEIIEAWIATQLEVAQAAIDALNKIIGIQFDPAFVAATKALQTRRVHIYGAKPDFFEDTEVLSRAVRDYAVAMRDPHDAGVALDRSLARLSEAERETGRFREARVRSARRKLFAAKRGVSEKVKAYQAIRIREAQKAMEEATRHLEDRFHITRVEPLEEEWEEDGKGTGQASASTGQQLRMKPKPSMRWH